MLQQQAKNAIHDFRQAIVRYGYDQADKRHIAAMFGSLKVAARAKQGDPNVLLNFFDGTITREFSYQPESTVLLPETFAQISSLEMKWQRDRLNAAGGADTIAGVLDELEDYLHLLPAVAKDMTIIVPSRVEQQTNDILAELERRKVHV